MAYYLDKYYETSQSQWLAAREIRRYLIELEIEHRLYHSVSWEALDHLKKDESISFYLQELGNPQDMTQMKEEDYTENTFLVIEWKGDLEKILLFAAELGFEKIKPRRELTIQRKVKRETL